jgi:hypothetical protein
MKLTEEEKAELNKLISEVVSTSEELGSITSSIYWNAAYFKQEAAREELRKFIDKL